MRLDYMSTGSGYECFNAYQTFQRHEDAEGLTMQEWLLQQAAEKARNTTVDPRSTLPRAIERALDAASDSSDDSEQTSHEHDEVTHIRQPEPPGEAQEKEVPSSSKNEGSADVEEPHLDEVHVADSVRLIALRDRMRECGYHVLADYIDVVASDEVPEWMEKIRRQKKRPPNVKRRFHKHLEQLAHWKVVARSASSPHGSSGSSRGQHFFSSYFEVPKSETETRAIFNGKALSEASPTPPPVNLADTRRFVERLKSYLSTRRKEKLNKVHIWMGDFRHWFHQLGMHPSRWKWFAVKCEEHLSYLWRVLPMGWSWSPAIAQAVAWSVLIAHSDAEKYLDLTPFKDRTARLPTFIETKEGGFVTVYYDNFFVISPSAAERDQIEKMCTCNFEEYQAVVKKSAMRKVNHKDFMSDGGFEYLGIHARGVPNGRSIILELRPAKLKKWLPPADQLSVRDAAIIVGRAVFCGLLRGFVFLRDELGRETVRIARQVGIQAAVRGWSSSWSDVSVIRSLWDRISNLVKNPVVHDIAAIERERSRNEEADRYILATDASLDGLGFCLYRRHRETDELELLQCEALKSGLPETAKIFDLEMEAVLRTVTREDIRALIHRDDATVTLVVDNSGVAHSLRNGITESARCQEMIELMFEEICRVRTVLVISADNPADVPSRTFKRKRGQNPRNEMEDRADRMLFSVRAYERGWCWASLPLKQWIADEVGLNGVRHAAGLDEGQEI